MPIPPPIARVRVALLLALAAAACGRQDQAPPADAVAAGAFAYDRAAPLDLRDSLDSVAADGLRTHEISFASPRGGRATGLMHVPPGGGRKAGIVFLHGAPGSAWTSTRFTSVLARRGAVVLSLNAPFVRRDGLPVTLTPVDSAETAQLVVDLQRAVDLLLRRPDVDSARIAFVGVSYGGSVGVTYAAVDPRPAAYVLLVANGGLVSHLSRQDGTLDGRVVGDLPEYAWNRWAAAMGPLEGLRHAHRIRPGTVLFQNGRADPLVPPWKAERLHRAAGPSHTVQWYESGHELTPQARVDMHRWLADRIGTRPTTAADAPDPR